MAITVARRESERSRASRWFRRVVVSALVTGMFSSVLVQVRPVEAQADTILVNEDVVPCSSSAGDPYVMSRDVCLAWGRLQAAAVARVEAVGGLASVRSLTLTRARSAVQAALWTIVNDAAFRPAAQRSPDERLVLGWLAGLARQQGIDVAQRALEMHDDFYRDPRPGPDSPPCTFTPPAPYQNEYPGDGVLREAFCSRNSTSDLFGIGVTNKPDATEWLRWASADVLKGKFSPEAMDIARAVGVQAGKVAVLAAAAVGSGVVTGVVAASLTATAATAAAAGTVLSGTFVTIGFLAFAAFVAVLAVVIAIYGTIVLFTDSRQGLVDALNEASKPIDPGVLFSTSAGRDLAYTLFTGWLGTQPAPPELAPVPPRVGTDPRFTVTPAGGTASAPTDTFTIRDASGNLRTVTMQGGYWIVADATGTTVTIDLPGLDQQGRAASISRVSLGDGMYAFVASGPDVVCSGTTNCEARREFTVTGSDGRPAVIRYVGTQDGQDTPTLVFDFDKVSTATIGVPASFFAAVFDTNGTRLSATYTWEIGNRCLTAYSTGCTIPPGGTPLAPDGSPITTVGTSQGIQYTFPSSGTWWVRVKASAPIGAATSNWFTVEVTNPAPTLAFTSATGDVVCASNGNTTCPPLVLGPLGGVGVSGIITDVASQYEIAYVEIDWGDGYRTWDDSGATLNFCARPGPNGTETFVRCIDIGGLDGERRAFSASHEPLAGVYGPRTVKVTVRDSGGNVATLSAPYVIPDTRRTQSITIDPAAPASFVESIPLAATATSGLPVTFTASPEQWCAVDGGRLYTARVGTCTVTANQAGDATYQPATATRDFSFTARTATISFPQPADTELPADGVTPLAITVGASDATGDAPAGTVEVTSTTPTVCTVADGQVSLLRTGSCTLRATIAPTVTNWTAPPVERTFTVVRTTQQITLFTPVLVGVIIGETPVQASTNSGLPLTVTASPSTVCSIAPSGSQWIATYVGAGDCHVTASQAGDDRWSPATDTKTITVVRSNQSSLLADQPPSIDAGGSFTVRVGGSTDGTPFVVAAGPAAVCRVNLDESTLAPTGFSRYRIDTVGGGNCLLTVDRLENAVFNAAPQVSATVVVNALAQTITFAPIADALVRGPAVVPVVGASSGLPVTVTSSTPMVCGVTSTGSVNLVGPGRCTLVANQAGNSRFGPAPSVTQSFVVGYRVTITNPGANSTVRRSRSTSVTVSVIDGRGRAADPVATRNGKCVGAVSVRFGSAVAGCATRVAVGSYRASFDTRTFTPGPTALSASVTVGGVVVGSTTVTVTVAR